jgi:hypothetical protein
MKKGKHVLFGIAAATTTDKFKLDSPGSSCHAMKQEANKTMNIPTLVLAALLNIADIIQR